jgi:transposase
VRGDARPAVVTADKGYDSRARVRLILGRGAEAVIPSRKNSAAPRVIDVGRYKDRNLVERFRERAEPYRRAATRYEKTPENPLAFAHIVSSLIHIE